MEQSRERFVRLAEKRTTRAIKDIRLLGNLSNRSNYKFNEDDVQQIFQVLEAELKLARKKFEESYSTSRDIDFKLS